MQEWQIVPARVRSSKQCFVVNDTHGTACMADGWLRLVEA